jgi:hypothetical protein
MLKIRQGGVTMMDDGVIGWLRNQEAWIRFCTEKQLLDIPADKEPVLADGKISAVINRLKSPDAGIQALCSGKLVYKSAGNAFWDLYFLADIGLTAADIGITDDIDRIFELQNTDGTFVVQIGMKPSYYCIPAILLSSLAKMGYRDDPRLMKFMDNVLRTQRLDGGWHCAVSRAAGQKLQDTESCPMDNLNILMLLGSFESYRSDPRFNGAIDLLLDHWRRRDEKWRPYGFGVGTDFMKLRYPTVVYGITRVLDVLSLYPYAVKSREFREMLHSVTDKSVGGRYFAEAASRAYGNFDFGQTKQPSAWLTFLVNKIQKNAGICISDI